MKDVEYFNVCEKAHPTLHSYKTATKKQKTALHNSYKR